AIGRALESCGDTIVYVGRDALRDVMGWLRDTPEHTYDYLVDVTAVEYRDRERPLEVVYGLRSLARRADLRVKVELEPHGDLTVDSVVPLWRGADWLEREVYDMFGVTFRGHPDLRRILMWETYAEGFPLRKDFPLRGRFSRAEHMLINIGPQHPATHGVLRLVVELDGETVVQVIPHLGYLHSGFEKLGEYRHYNQIIPLTDRTDYLSPMANNVGFALAAEKLM